MVKKIIPVAGIIVFIILSGIISELSSISINIQANFIVLTGTLVCCLISYPNRLFSRLFHSIQYAFSKDIEDPKQIIDKIVTFSRIRRREGLLALEDASQNINNAFLKMGIEMVVDGYDRYTIFKTLESRYDNYLKAKKSEIDLINTIVKLIPIFGFVGTIIGLIHVLNNMGSPELIGKGVATALLTTFYGLLYANILFLPISKKISEKTRQESTELALIIEGVLDISDNINSKAIGYRLRYCLGDFSNYIDEFAVDNSMTNKVLPTVKLALKKQYSR